MSLESKESSCEKVKVYVDSLEEAQFIVRKFWESMPDGQEILQIGERSQDWGQELTMGDRTKIIQAKLPMDKKKGRYIVIFQGNHQNLSSDAISWLKGKGY